MNHLFRFTRRALAVTALVLFSLPALALPEAFSAALKQVGIPPERVAVVIQPVDALAPLLAHNADSALNPASVMKLVTSFAALEQLAPPTHGRRNCGRRARSATGACKATSSSREKATRP
jgi:D-alanyl-D-alanine carboxypeptidase